MGYSEPGAGSDLASLACRGELIGDQYQLNGRKVWTSDAMHCDYIFVLIRTDMDAPQPLPEGAAWTDAEVPGYPRFASLDTLYTELTSIAAAMQLNDIDIDGDGNVDMEEFRQGVASLGFEARKRERKVFKGSGHRGII